MQQLGMSRRLPQPDSATGKSSARTRDYPPLLLASLVALSLLAILPSSLNLPQSSPSQTLEYAPVPPEDGEKPPVAGNFSSLGLGRSGSLGRGSAATEAGPGESEAAGPGGAVGKNPSTKRCVGRPPRQTEDPLSPPCVAFFSGSNGGATYPGVTRDEIRVVIYLDGEQEDGEPPECGTFEDLDQPPDREKWTSTNLRVLERYFNDRFQTYGRRVHFFVHRGTCSEPTPETRRADATTAWQRVRPFAVLNFSFGDHTTVYDQSLTQRGVLSFGGNPVTLRPQSHFSQAPGLVWGHLPTMEQQARLFGSLVCERVVPFPVSFGDSEHAGRARKFGVLFTDDPGFPDHRLLRDLVIEQIERCGGRVALSGGHPPYEQAPDLALQTMAEFRQQEITTILWTGHFETNLQHSAVAIDYTPEVIALGQPGGMDEYVNNAAFGNAAFLSQAWVVANHTYQGPPRSEQCGVAIMETEPAAVENDIMLGCERYPHLLQLFTGIQVAGPQLTPRTIERGLRAIPARPSRSNKAPACFYEPGDYTCVKDGIVEWWDPQGKASARRSSEDAFVGCWRLTEGGKRYLAGSWSGGDLPQFRRGPQSDPCNSANSS